MSEAQKKKAARALANLTPDELADVLTPYQNGSSTAITPVEPTEIFFRRGIERGLIDANKYHGWFDVVTAKARHKENETTHSMVAIHAAALCENGPRTRDVMQRALKNMIGEKRLWEVEIDKLRRQTGVIIDEDGYKRKLNMLNELEGRVSAFLADESDAALAELESYIRTTISIFSEDEHIFQRRGRGKGVTYKRMVIWEYAADYYEKLGALESGKKAKEALRRRLKEFKQQGLSDAEIEKFYPDEWAALDTLQHKYTRGVCRERSDNQLAGYMRQLANDARAGKL